MQLIPNETKLTNSGLVKKGNGIFYSIDIKSYTSGTILSIYDNESPSGTLILSEITLSSEKDTISFESGILFVNGLYVKINGTAEIIIWYK